MQCNHSSLPLLHLNMTIWRGPQRAMGKPLSSIYLRLSTAHLVKLLRLFQKWQAALLDQSKDEWN